MGPRRSRRGNAAPQGGPKLFRGEWKFQWGHVGIDVETDYLGFPFGQEKQMFQWGHVGIDVETVASQLGLVAQAQFQWSHLGIDVETVRESGSVNKRVRRFQWGHVAIDVETYQLEPVQLRKRGRFNGATSESTWKQQARSDPEGLRRLAFQWGHVGIDVETPTSAGAYLTGPTVAMGPRRKRRGDGWLAVDALNMPGEDLSQWGHVVIDMETLQKEVSRAQGYFSGSRNGTTS